MSDRSGDPDGRAAATLLASVAGAAEFGRQAAKPVRMLGEDLVLYRDKSGTYGLVDQHCAHRRADLSYGFVEERGLRCNYHGWLFDHTGTVPGAAVRGDAHPEGRFKDRVRIKSVSGARRKAASLWVYLGPQPAPLRARLGPFITRARLQADSPSRRSRATGSSARRTRSTRCTSNGCTDNWSRALRGEDGHAPPAHQRLGFDEFDYGFVYRRIREDTTEHDELWTVGRVCLWPNCLYTAALRMAGAHRRRAHAQCRVVHRRAARRRAVRAGHHPLLARPRHGRANRGAGSTRTS